MVPSALLCSPRMRRVFLVIAATVSMLASPTLAQTEDELERARTLFVEGVELTHEERWDEAIARFRQVLEVRATPQVKYNLALALEASGQLSEAAALLREIQDSRELDRRARRDVQRLMRRIGPRLGQITIRIAGDEAGVRVYLDDEEIPLHRIGQPLTVDPGERRLVMKRRGRVVATQSVQVESGQLAEVTLVETEVRPEPVQAVAVVTQDEPAPAAARSVVDEWWFWTILGAVVVVAGGVAIGVAASSSGPPDPVQGNLNPGFIEVVLP